MITTLEDFKQAAIELCEKYGFDNDLYITLEEGIKRNEKEFKFQHGSINGYGVYTGKIAEDVLEVVEKEMIKIQDPLHKAKSHLENLNKELIAAGKQPLSIE